LAQIVAVNATGISRHPLAKTYQQALRHDILLIITFFVAYLQMAMLYYLRTTFYTLGQLSTYLIMMEAFSGILASGKRNQ
jgi:hypothetical protein